MTFLFKNSQFCGMSSYTFKNFLAEKYESSALKCRVGRLHTMPEKIFTFKSEIYMEKHQNYLRSPLSGQPDGLSTSYIYVENCFTKYYTIILKSSWAKELQAMYHTANSSFRVRTFPSYVNIMDIAGIRTVVFDITVRIPGTSLKKN